jgi:hypothetical protein
MIKREDRSGRVPLWIQPVDATHQELREQLECCA